MRLKVRSRRFNQRGSGIVEGVGGLVLIIGATVLLAQMLLNVGFLLYYKQKVGYAATQAADYAASQLAWGNARKKSREYTLEQTRNRLNDMLELMELPKISLRQDDLQLSTIDRQSATIKITVRIRGLKFPAQSVLPVSMRTVTETACVNLSTGKPPALLDIFPKGHREWTTRIPVYRLGTQFRDFARAPAVSTLPITAPAGTIMYPRKKINLP